MRKNEKFAVLDSVIAATEMTEKEIVSWFQSRQTSHVATEGRSTSDGIIFPIAYKSGLEFEVLPEFIPERKDEIWGYEIMPGIIFAKRCGDNGDVEDTSKSAASTFAANSLLNGERGTLPSEKDLKDGWSEELKKKIQEMGKFLCENGVDAETKCEGAIWCKEDVDFLYGRYFVISNRKMYHRLGHLPQGAFRLVMKF